MYQKPGGTVNCRADADAGIDVPFLWLHGLSHVDDLRLPPNVDARVSP